MFWTFGNFWFWPKLTTIIPLQLWVLCNLCTLLWWMLVLRPFPKIILNVQKNQLIKKESSLSPLFPSLLLEFDFQMYFYWNAFLFLWYFCPNERNCNVLGGRRKDSVIVKFVTRMLHHHWNNSQNYSEKKKELMQRYKCKRYHVYSIWNFPR